MMGGSNGTIDTAPATNPAREALMHVFRGHVPASDAVLGPMADDALAWLREQHGEVVEAAHELAQIRETRGGNAGQMVGRLDAGNEAWARLYAALETSGLPVEPLTWGEIEARAEVHGGR